MSKSIGVKGRKAIKLIIDNNLPVKTAMRAVGYSQGYIDNGSGAFMRRQEVKQALHKAGLSDDYLLKRVKKMIKVGSQSTNISADIASKNIELAFRLSGALDKEQDTSTNTSNIYIKELKLLDVSILKDKLKDITKDL